MDFARSSDVRVTFRNETRFSIIPKFHARAFQFHDEEIKREEVEGAEGEQTMIYDFFLRILFIELNGRSLFLLIQSGTVFPPYT